jgi:2-keto-4-pentenoate hydratase/2-oxohepta-3-ene-1,7-dioic acid hydratase in catechol pathway
VRFITFERDGIETVGVRCGDELIDLSLAAPERPRTLLGLIETGMLQAAGEAALGADASARLPLRSIKYLPVIPRPPKFLGFGINYPSHVGERPKSPGYYLSGPHRFCAQGEPMIRPLASNTLDFEIELALVVGKRASRVPAAKALDFIAGYTIFNDGSVRGYYDGPATLVLMKNGDKTGPLGPELVTPDELPAGADGLRLTTRRNGKVVQRDTTANMFWKVPEIVELASFYMTLEAGDIVATGTCGGTVADVAIKNGKKIQDEGLDYLRAGEELEFEIEGIGVLRNGVVDELC